MAQMPFSPCDAANIGACTDESYKMLHYIFGDMVQALAEGADPNTVEAGANVLATMFGFFNSGLLVVAGLIVTYVALMGVMNTASDGEAMGKDWSSVWTPIRIVAGGLVLLPTTSGYSFIQTIVMTFTLWGVGMANGVYSAGMATSVLSPNGLVQGVNDPGNYYGIREFATQYMDVAVCAQKANSLYGANVQPMARTVTRAGITETIMEYRDNSITNLAGGAPICGTVKINQYSAQAVPTDGEKAIELLRQRAQAQKVAQVNTVLMKELSDWVATWPQNLNEPGWTAVSASRFNTIVKKSEDAIASKLVGSVTGSQGDIDQAMNDVLQEIVDGGWASAGGWYQRVGFMRTMIQKAVSEPVGSVVTGNYAALPDDARLNEFNDYVQKTVGIIRDKADQENENAGPSSFADLSDVLPKSIKDLDVSNLNAGIDSKMSSAVNSFMYKAVALATGSEEVGSIDVPLIGEVQLCGMAGQVGGSLNRMKCLGDYMVSSEILINTAVFGINTATGILRIIAGGADSVRFFGSGANTSPMAEGITDMLKGGIVEQLLLVKSYVKPLGFYFSVVLPSLPYGIFLIVIVGWVLGVLQAMICAPLWAVLHMTPSRTFIGSNQQGYTLMLAIFLRPSLAILGLFAAMLVSDPIIDFLAKGFFEYRGAIVTSTGNIGWLAEFFTFGNWMIVFGGILGPVLYMTYGLPQALPDSALRWISAGIEPIGSSSAISEARTAGNTAMRIGGGGSGGGGSRSGGGGGGPAGGEPGGGGQLPGDKSLPASNLGDSPIANPQGTPPQQMTDSSSDSKTDVASSDEASESSRGSFSSRSGNAVGTLIGAAVMAGGQGAFGLARGDGGAAFKQKASRVGAATKAAFQEGGSAGAREYYGVNDPMPAVGSSTGIGANGQPLQNSANAVGGQSVGAKGEVDASPSVAETRPRAPDGDKMI